MGEQAKARSTDTRVAVARVVVSFVALSAADWATGAHISLRSFYILPIALAAWSLGRMAAFALAVVGAIFVIFLDIHGGLGEALPTFIASDTVTRFIVFLAVGELTVRVREARQHAEENAVHLQSVLDAATEVAIVGWDRGGSVSTFNPGAERLLGRPAKEMLGLSTAKGGFLGEETKLMETPEVTPGKAGKEPLPSDFARLVERVKTDNTDKHDWSIVRGDGVKRTLRMIVTPRRDAGGEEVGYLGVATDVTEEREAADALRAKNEELRAFAYTVSHDLKAPLRGISGYAQELQHKHKAGLTERATFCVDQILTATRALDRLIDDLLKYSRLAREDVVFQNVDLEAAIASLLRDRRSTIEEAHAEVTLKLDVKKVRTWERGLLQALGNMIDNALKYARTAKPPQISVESRQAAGGLVRIVVSDNGIGFDPKYSERIFGLFNRLSQPTEYAGTGVGLAIVKRMADKVGGAVSATGGVGKGATFTLDLPRRGSPPPKKDEP